REDLEGEVRVLVVAAAPASGGDAVVDEDVGVDPAVEGEGAGLGAGGVEHLVLAAGEADVREPGGVGLDASEGVERVDPGPAAGVGAAELGPEGEVVVEDPMPV